MREHASRFDEKGLARRRQLDTALRAIEQRRVERFLELSDLLAEWRLRDVQAYRATTEV